MLVRPATAHGRGTKTLPSYDLVTKGNVFSLNLLDKKEESIMRIVEKPSSLCGEKLRGLEFGEEETGAPILKRAFAYLECRVQEIYEPGDHALVIGEVIHAGRHGEGEPITCADLKWHYGG